MLSRVAENLFWVGRYMERAENIARLLDVAQRMASLPREPGIQGSNEWSSILIAAGARSVFGEAIERANVGMAVDHLIFADDNPSSVKNCMIAARENARSVRFALTQDGWEAINSSWAQIRHLSTENVYGAGLSDVIDWIKTQSATFRGAMHGTMVRDDGYAFLRLGTAIERLDSTARLLDVKYHVLLPSVHDVGSSMDHYQWLSLLRAAAAQRAYFFMRKNDVTARGVAEFLILEPRFPRTILYNAKQLESIMVELETFYGQVALCHDGITSFVQMIEERSIDDILATGLHEVLTEIIVRNYGVADQLAQAYGFAPVVTEDEHANESVGQ